MEIYGRLSETENVRQCVSHEYDIEYDLIFLFVVNSGSSHKSHNKRPSEQRVGPYNVIYTSCYRTLLIEEEKPQMYVVTHGI